MFGLVASMRDLADDVQGKYVGSKEESEAKLFMKTNRPKP